MMPTAENSTASTGIASTPPMKRGASTRLFGSIAIISIAANCSPAFIRPISAVSDVPECMAISDHVVLLATQGRIVAQGTPADLMNSTDPETRQFVRGEPDGPVKFHYPAKPIAEDFGVGGSVGTGATP